MRLYSIWVYSRSYDKHFGFAFWLNPRFVVYFGLINFQGILKFPGLVIDNVFMFLWCDLSLLQRLK